MAKLNQIIAVEKGIKSRSHQELSDAHHALQKPQLLSGISRTYQPRDEEGEKFPPESTRVQMRAEEMLKKTQEILTRLFDVTATKDLTNCRARADVGGGGTVLEDLTRGVEALALKVYYGISLSFAISPSAISR